MWDTGDMEEIAERSCGNRGVEGPAENGSGFSPKKFGTKPPPSGPRQKGRPYPPFRGPFFRTLRRDFRQPHSSASRSLSRRAVRQLRSRSENPVGTLQAETVTSAVETDFASADATFVATDRAAVRDRKIPPEFFKRESCDERARDFSHIKRSEPNRKSGICAYSPGRTFRAIYCIRGFSRSRLYQTSHRLLPWKIPPGLSGMADGSSLL